MKMPGTKDCKFTVECLEEDMPFEGNCSAIDDETDKANEDYIRKELEGGNVWAWCTVKVVCSWKGFEGVDYLGGCSYKSEKDFCQPGGYYDDMKNQAYDAMITEIKRLKKLLA